jgi:hypothetical protein
MIPFIFLTVFPQGYTGHLLKFYQAQPDNKSEESILVHHQPFPDSLLTMELGKYRQQTNLEGLV